MEIINSIDKLLALYEPPVPDSLTKVSDHLTPLYEKWVSAARFCILTTVGNARTDGSPRGDKGPVVHVSDNQTLLMPDWPGNNRLDSLRNIIFDSKASMMFMIPGITTVVRVNGNAQLTADENLRKKFDQKGRKPAIVIIFKIKEVYVQCSKAVIRAELWKNSRTDGIPSLYDIINEAKSLKKLK